MQREPPPAIARKKRLGVLVDSLETIYQRDILRGVVEVAESTGSSLWCFMGGCIPAPGDATEVRHLVYDLVGPLNSDALILCSSTIIHNVGVAGLLERCERYRPLPICSIGVELPGHTNVLVDNQIGMRHMVEHLITVHGLHRIAFIRGPLGNEEAEFRLEAYRQALSHHKIAFDEQLVCIGNFMESGGLAAISHFAHTLGTRFHELEAIVASNDGMAFGAINALNERTVVVPRDMKVTGFDDVEEAALAQPQLSTVRQPLVRQGQTAAKLLLDQLESGPTATRTILETDLLLRRSCGCDSTNRMVKYSAPPPGDFGFEAGVVFRRDRIIDGMTRSARGAFGAAGHDWQGRLLNALLLDIRTGEPDAFPRNIQDLLEKLTSRGVELDSCRSVLDAMRTKLLPALRSDSEARDRAENLLHSAVRSVDDLMLRQAKRLQLRLSYSTRVAAEACGAISACFDRAKLVEAFHQWLPRAGVRSGLLVLYPQDSPHAAELLTGFDERPGRRLLSASRFDRQLLVPGDYDIDRAGGCHFVLPLALEDRLYGHLVLKLDVEAGYTFRAIALAIACSVAASELREHRWRPPAPAADAEPPSSSTSVAGGRRPPALGGRKAS